MKRTYVFGFVFALLVMVAGVRTASATMDTIKFGVNSSLTYSPNSLQVSVGDTIVWMGDFGAHPLELNTKTGAGFPAGATPLSPPSSGTTSYMYVVSVAGTYDYQCHLHAQYGMVGSFTTTKNAVPNASAAAVTALYPIIPNPASRTIMIDYSLASPGHARISIVSTDGREVGLPLDGMAESGMQMLDFDISKLAAGAYIVTLEANGTKVSEQLVVSK